MTSDQDFDDLAPLELDQPMSSPEWSIDDLSEEVQQALANESRQQQTDRLASLEQKVAAQALTPWSIDFRDAAVLLESQPSFIPRHSVANKLHSTQGCIFFVEPGPAAGKRSRMQAGSSSSTQAPCDDSWVTAGYGSASGGSVTCLDDGSHLAVLHISGSNQAKLGLTFGKYCLVLQQGHPEFDTRHSDGSPRETKEAGSARLRFQHRAPDRDLLWLVHSTPKASDKSGPAGGSTATEGAVATFRGDINVRGSAMIGESLTVGRDGSGTIFGRLAGRQADHAECMPRFDEAEELNGGDVVALVGDDNDVQKVSRSARGSERAEWRVVSTDPQMLGNAPEPDMEQTVVPIVFSGQVRKVPALG